MEIQILKNTPFHIRGKILSIKDFRTFYGEGLCIKSTTDQDLYEYIKIDKTYHEWFKPYVRSIEDYMPLSVIIEGILYIKQMDGMYHKFLAGSPIDPAYSIGKVYTTEVKRKMENCRYRNSIWVCTNNVNRKV